MSATAALAAQVSALRFADLSSQVRTVAKQCIADVLAVAIGGHGEPAVSSIRSVSAPARDGAATVLGSALRSDARTAALVNGTAAHALDYDDVHAVMGGHPSAPVLPAALALSEELQADGPELVTAFVAGYETECRVGTALGAAHYETGFHTTATAGTIGAATACARLLGLDAARTEAAIGIAATSASGLKSMFGTMCKPLHAGQAASSGVLAARLAQHGFTSAADAIGCSQGLAATQTTSYQEAPCFEPFGTPWHILNTLFKVHASCYLTHAGIESALKLRADGLRHEDIDKVELTVSPEHLAVCDIRDPRTRLEGKFSLRFTTALALMRGRADESQFNDEAVRDATLTALRDRVTICPDEHIPRYACALKVSTCDGRDLTASADEGRRSWRDDPMEQAEALETKFDTLVEPALGIPTSQKLQTRIASLETLKETGDIGRMVNEPERTANESNAGRG